MEPFGFSVFPDQINSNQLWGVVLLIRCNTLSISNQASREVRSKPPPPGPLIFKVRRFWVEPAFTYPSRLFLVAVYDWWQLPGGREFHSNFVPSSLSEKPSVQHFTIGFLRMSFFIDPLVSKLIEIRNVQLLNLRMAGTMFDPERSRNRNLGWLVENPTGSFPKWEPDLGGQALSLWPTDLSSLCC